MSYVGIIVSAVLHVGGLFLLLTARAPEPLIPMGSDTPMAVDIISLDEYNALVSRAPTPSTLAALRTQPEPPRSPVLADTDPILDALDETPPAPEPEPSVELAMRLPEPVLDTLPDIEEAPEPDAPSVTTAPAPKPLALDETALNDLEVDPAELLPPDDVRVAIAPPTPKPPRGVMDALPQIDTSSDEPPPPAETEGEGEEARSEPAPAPAPAETAAAAAEEDLAPLSTPLPSRKPRGSLAVASAEEPRPAPPVSAPEPAPAPPPAPEPEPEPASPPSIPSNELTAAEIEEERRLMEALMEQMRAAQGPSPEELAAAAAEEEARARAAESARLEQERAAERLRAEQAEAQRRAQAELERQRRERERAEREARERAERQRQLAELNATVAPETRADAIAAAPAAPPQDSFLGGDSALASILGAASNAAQSARTGPSFGQGSAAPRGVSLTPGETEAVLNQLRGCWRVDTVSANARNLVVTFRAEIRQNGFVNQNSITLVEPRPTPPEFEVAVRNARTALQDMRCQPFALPPQKYNAWRDIVIRFDPAQMVLQ